MSLFFDNHSAGRFVERPDGTSANLEFIHAQLIERILAIRQGIAAYIDSIDLIDSCVEIISDSLREIHNCESEATAHRKNAHGLQMRDAELKQDFTTSVRKLYAAELSFATEVSNVCDRYDVPKLAAVFGQEFANLKSRHDSLSLDPRPVRRIKKALEECIHALQGEGDSRGELVSLAELKERKLDKVARALYVADQEFLPIPQRLRKARSLLVDLQQSRRDGARELELANTLSQTAEQCRVIVARMEAKKTLLAEQMDAQLERVGSLTASTYRWLQDTLPAADLRKVATCGDLDKRAFALSTICPTVEPCERVERVKEVMISLGLVSEKISEQLGGFTATPPAPTPLTTTLPTSPTIEYTPPPLVTKTQQPQNSEDLNLPVVVNLSTGRSLNYEMKFAQRPPKAPTGVHVRWMIRRDMPTVMRIENSSFEFPWTEDDFIRCLRQRDCIGMVAEKRNEVAGYMIYELHKSRIHILSFAVDPTLRRQGVGEAMLEKLVNKLSYQRRNRIVLEVRESNLPALLFFRALGFRATSLLKHCYEDTLEDGILMQHIVRNDRQG